VAAVPSFQALAVAVLALAALAGSAIADAAPRPRPYGSGVVEQAAGDAGGPAPAVLSCDPVASPGRVRCAVDARVAAGEAIAWGDVVLTKAPPFVAALRGRIGPHDATARDATAWQWAFALVARAPGRGVVEGRVRLVVCRGESCGPREIPVAGEVVVGPPP
jgi:hypothetical protein